MSKTMPKSILKPPSKNVANSTMRDVAMLKQMSFRELKEELFRCENNPQRELFIRKLMKEKAVKYKLMKRDTSREIQKNVQFAPVQNNQNNASYQDEDDNLIDDILNDIDDGSEENDNYITRNSSRDKINMRLNGRNNKDDDDLLSGEISKDKMNNSLMDRMNGELDIRNLRKKGSKKEFVSPYSNVSDIGDNYALFEESKRSTINPRDFSNKRFLKKQDNKYNTHKKYGYNN